MRFVDVEEDKTYETDRSADGRRYWLNRICWSIGYMQRADWEQNIRNFRAGKLDNLQPNYRDAICIVYPGWIAANWFVKEMEL